MSSPSAHEPSYVLLVEDTPDDELLSLRALRTCGRALQVQVARTGLRARRILGLDETRSPTPHRAPDLIVSDLKLPGLDGYDLLCRVRADWRYADLPFLIFSSSNETSDVERCTWCDADAYVQKPVAYDEYIAGLQAAVGWALDGCDRRELPPCVLTRFVKPLLRRVA